MRTSDTLRFGQSALRAYPGRTALIVLAMAIGVASVIVLTSLGEGARLYVTGQFKSLGSNLLIVLPGRSETTGGLPPLMGTTPRDLTVDDAMSLKRIAQVAEVAPLVIGAAPVSNGNLEREITVAGTTAGMQIVLDLELARGRFLPAGDPNDESAHCVIGDKVAAELYPNQQPLGQWLRVGERRFRVTGILKKRDQVIGMDTSDSVYIPVASAQSLFNAPSLFRILIQMKGPDQLEVGKQQIQKIIKQRHDGEDDVTIIAQDALVGTFDRILSMLTYAVAAIAAISLLVAGILIMNVMMISVSQRKAEIGLLKAMGAPTHQVLSLFLTEALMLSLLGGLVGLLAGYGGARALNHWLPGFEVATPAWAVIAALIVTFLTGLLFGSIPARKAAKLDPVLALAGK